MSRTVAGPRVQPYWHGGVPGLRPGDWIMPGQDRKHHDGCPWCEARRTQSEGGPVPAIDPLPWHTDMVYATTHRLYAKHYASLYGRGDLYRVEADRVPERSLEDSIPTFMAPRWRVVAVIDRAVRLTWNERRRLYREWGEYDEQAGKP